MFPNIAEPPKCPVKMYKLYRANRPQNMSHEDSPFFLGINRNGKSSQWYRSQPMGNDTLGSIMKRMCVAAGLRGKHTNHSVRKTTMTNLVQANIDSNPSCQLSSHKNVNSVNRYAVASKFQQKEMCNVLQNPDESSYMLALPGPSREARVVPVSRGRSAGANVSNSAAVSSSYQFGLNKSRMFAGAVFNGPVLFHFHKHQYVQLAICNSVKSQICTWNWAGAALWITLSTSIGLHLACVTNGIQQLMRKCANLSHLLLWLNLRVVGGWGNAYWSLK